METYNQKMRRSHSYKARDSQEARNYLLDIKMSELHETKEELKKAKDDATQSWLDSKTLVDELEKLQSSLAATKDRITKSTTVISDLESQLETTDTAIRSKKEDELELRTTINGMNQELERTREEMEQLKLEKDEERRARSELKQVLRVKKQSLRALQLTLRAIRLESEAYGSSAAEALRYINNSEMDNTRVRLTQDEYSALTRRAKEENSLADWRVSVSMEQRLVAEASRDSASRRLKELHSDNKPRKRKMKDNVEGSIKREAAEEQDSSKLKVGAQINNRHSAFPKARAKLMAESSQGNPRQQSRTSRSNNKKVVKKKKPSLFIRISNFLVRKITRLFG